MKTISQMDLKTLEKKILAKEITGWEKVKLKDYKKIKDFSKGYIAFLNNAKTERESVIEIEAISKKNGFVDLNELKNLTPQEMVGKKIICKNKDKSIILCIVGSDNLTSGMNIIAAHIDAPRLDLKQNPLYEDMNLAFFKTHYYGGVKKYQWVNIPLALHGKIVRKDGVVIDIKIGENEDEPVFVINDLLPHLAKRQLEKKAAEAITGEDLNILVGNMPVSGKNLKEKIKLMVMKILNERYGLIESDFNTAEIEAVPAFKSRFSGFDESLITGYGQDDRICSYASLLAICKIKNVPKRTAVAVMFDKEEIGSFGPNSAQSVFLFNFIGTLLEILNKSVSDNEIRKVFMNSYGLSADVDAGIDPNFKDVFDLRNTAKLGNGVIITKYTGVGGKSSAHDANAEYIGKLRKVFLENNVIFQFGEIGKVDEGGGGTIAKFFANYGMEIVDCGPPILGMHSPYEVASCFDLYQTFLAYSVFYTKFF